MLEFALTVLLAPIALCLVMICAAVVAVDGHNPFYSQPRVGKGGKVFRMWKLRTMVWNADELLQDHLSSNPEAAEEWRLTQKLKCDPRITTVGRFLRKTSLDELPQFWNVLTGTMSLVGPRPMMVQQQSHYPGEAYYRMKPGITGMWQISDRNNCSFSERAGYDEAYDRIVSLKLDLSILLRTVSVVLRGTGH